MKYNTNGDEIWIANYNNGLNDIATSLTLDDFGNVYVTGNSDGSGSRFDYATVKYDSTGIQQWITRYNYSNEYDNEARFIAVDKYNDVYVTGVTRLNNIANSLTIKYSQTLTGISQSITETPIEFSLAQNYPNPFNPKTIVSYKLRVTGYTELNIFDVLGNEVATLVNETKPAGSYEVEFDGSKYASGMYFYSLEVDGNHIDTKRMILLK